MIWDFSQCAFHNIHLFDFFPSTLSSNQTKGEAIKTKLIHVGFSLHRERASIHVGKEQSHHHARETNLSTYLFAIWGEQEFPWRSFN